MTVSHGQTLQSTVHWNSSVLNCCWKQESNINVVMSGGKLFHTRQPAMCWCGQESLVNDLHSLINRLHHSDTEQLQFTFYVW